MTGHIKQYTRKYKTKSGKTVERTRWRARYPDPAKPPSSGGQIERLFKTKHEAEDWLHDRKSAVRDGSHVHPRKARTSLRAVADSWRATWADKGLAPTTMDDYESILFNHVLPRFGDVPIAAITAADVDEWLRGLRVVKPRTYRGKKGKQVTRTYGLHPETIHHCASVLRSIFKLAIRYKLVTTNPCTADSISLPSKRVARATAKPQLYLTSDEVHKLASALPAHWRLPVYVAAYVGLRAGELWALRRQDVLLNDIGGHLHVCYAIKDLNGKLLVGPTKTHQQRKPSLPRPLQPMLEEHLAASPRPLRRIRTAGAHGYPCIVHTDAGPALDWTDDPDDDRRLLFTTAAGHPVRHLNFLRREWRTHVDALWPAGHRLHGLRFHDLRHTCASLSLAATGNLHVVKERLGHEDIKTTVNRYGHLLPSVDAALADALGEMFSAAEAKVVDLPVRSSARF